MIEIRNSAQGFRNPGSDWNPESTVWNPEQDCLGLPYVCWRPKMGPSNSQMGLACSEISAFVHGYHDICLDPLLRSAITKLTRVKMTFWKRSCLPFTKSFRKIRLVKWNTTFWVGSFQWRISESNGTSEKVVLFFRTECSKRKFVFHFFKVIFDTIFTPSRSFFGKWNWFVQIVNTIPGRN